MSGISDTRERRRRELEAEKSEISGADIKEYLIRHIQECGECQELALKHWGRIKE